MILQNTLNVQEFYFYIQKIRVKYRTIQFFFTNIRIYNAVLYNIYISTYHPQSFCEVNSRANYFVGINPHLQKRRPKTINIINI